MNDDKYKRKECQTTAFWRDENQGKQPSNDAITP